MREQLISIALRQRWAELCEQRSRTLVPHKFVNAALFVSQLREQLLEQASTSDSPLPDGRTRNLWLESDQDCLEFLRELSLCRSLQVREIPVKPSVNDFLEALEVHRPRPEQRFRLLSQRYKCPLNITLASETDILEYLLKRLMVQDRAVFERRSLSAWESDDLLLKLNLVAVAAASVKDLRYLDALNYYYEQLPAGWVPKGQQSWLLASYFGLYARSLRHRF